MKKLALLLALAQVFLLPLSVARADSPGKTLGLAENQIQRDFGAPVRVQGTISDAMVLTYQASSGTWIAKAGGGGGGPPTGVAGGDLGGTYPNPTVLSLTHVTNTLPVASFPLLAPNGTAGAPSYSFSAPNAGFFWDGVGVAWGHSGLQDGHLGKNILITSNAALQFGNTVSFNTTADAGVSRGNPSTICIGNGSSGDVSGTLIAGAVGVGATPGASGESPAAYEAQIPTSQYAQRLITVGNGSISGSVSLFVKNRGTLAVPVIVQNNDQLGGVYFQGATGIFGEASTYATISGFVDGVPSGDTSAPGRLVFATTPLGSATPSNRWAILNAGNLVGTSGLALGWSSSSSNPTVAADTRILRGAAGNVLLDNNAGSFGLLQLGGTSSSFPAIKRNLATIDFRLADDSTYTNIAAGTGSLLGLSLRGNASGSTDFIAGATPTPTTYTLPSADGTAGQVLTTAGGAGSHVLSWGTPTVTPGFPILAPAGTAAAPSYSFSADSTAGLYDLGSGVMGLGNGFVRLNLGGTSASFPAIKRNAATIKFRLADDSGDADISAGAILASREINAQVDVAVGLGPNVQISSPTASQLLLQQYGVSDFARLMFGGTTPSFPAIKRNGAALNFRLADDSGDADITAGRANLNLNGAVSGLSVATIEAAAPAGNYGQRLYALGDGSTSGGLFLLEKNRGTLAAPLIVQNNDQLGGIYFNGSTGIFGEAGAYATIAGYVDGVPSGDTSYPGRLVFATTPSGSSVTSPRWAILSTGNLVGTSGLAFGWSSSSTDPTVAADTRILRGAAGNVLLDNNAGSFGLLQLGGTSASFPAIKRSSASVFMRLADDSGYASLQCHDITTDGAILVSGNISTSTGDLRVTGGSLVLGGRASTYANITTTGWGVPAIYGKDFRQGVTSADGAATTLYTAANGTSVFRITADIFATAVTSGTATYTVTWTQNSSTQTMVVSSTVLNTLGTATDLINPDNGTAITAKLTGTFSQTVTVTALVEQLN